ncbi:MAG: response regulator [Phycisphaerales bacterium]
MAELVGRGHDCSHVSGLGAGMTAVRTTKFEVVLIDPELPDGDGLSLVEFIRDQAPATKPIVFSREPTLSNTLAAIRRGAVDVVTEPQDLVSFIERVETALVRGAWEQRREERIRRLQQVCRELEDAREEISGQVEGLCREMVHAYEDLTGQLDDVAMATEFRTLMRMELDVEESLRTALEYLLTKTGPTNAAVFLPDLDGRYSLGAYVNYDCPRESIEPTIGSLARTLCPRMADEPSIMAFPCGDALAEFCNSNDVTVIGSDAVAFSCRHEGECLAVAVLFRNEHDGFATTLSPTLDTLRTIFGEHLARIIDVHHRAKPSWPADDTTSIEGDGDFDHPFPGEDDEPDWGFGGLAA